MKSSHRKLLAVIAAATINWNVSAEVMGPPVPYRHTSIKTNACQAPSASMVDEFDAREVTAKQCPALEDWQLFVVFLDDLSWLEIARGQALWSTQEQVTKQSGFGNDPHVGSDGVQWLPGNGKVNTLIFQVDAQEDPTPNGPGKRVSRLALIRLDGEAPAFCGYAKTKEEAKAMAEKRDTCKGTLKQYPFR